MKLLLTSSGITNKSIHNALVELMGKPVGEANALFVPTGVYPFEYGQRYAWNPIAGQAAPYMCQLGWKSIGILELSVLPSIDKSKWLPSLAEADALLVWGGDPLFLSYWLQASGLAEVLSDLPNLVYVGVSAGSITVASLFAETYSAERCCAGTPLKTEEIIFSLDNRETTATLITASGIGLTTFAVIPHFNNKNHFAGSLTNTQKWAAKLPVPVYAIDDESAIKVNDGTVEVISEGEWKLFTP
ncbi:Type 1 glutamine amidotransferase-like domain-containing protein [Pinibacter aurantiacus]|uniref:Type 1 glutamine amidotransferase-like domain-containing protein n=1 Tax=Pinibacter aurantiacus TaxID=2851599 RepID=A0A9E2SCZ0_9BACT|nr:Type 1 glutamine amidotransferase-like domain-containing protein [Pinibacter aurantiacus]MBV4359092.1 Type 1 glutamine amidotransferase-like domain-containing protein [Pinibacter aurantiacus]